MSRYPKKYFPQAMLGIFGLFLVFSPFILKIPGDFQAFNAGNDIKTQTNIDKAEVEGSEDLERGRIAQRSETAKELKKAGVMPSTQSLKILKYYDDPKHDPLPETTGYLQKDVVTVYDSAGRCIGVIKNRNWYWKHYYPQFCESNR